MEQNSHYQAERIAAQKDYIMGVYNWMCLALLITGGVAFLTAMSPFLLNFIYSSNITFFGLIIVELILVYTLTANISKMSAATARASFLAYSAINGMTLSAIFIVYSENAISMTFLVTAGTFAVMSAIGHFTKKDLTSFGSLAFMLLIGLILGSVINMFLQSDFMYYVLTYVGIFLFTGLIAYDTQKLKSYCPIDFDDEDGEIEAKSSIIGALTLYLDFVNLFLYIIRLFRDR